MYHADIFNFMRSMYINFSKYHFNIKVENNTQTIFDIIRKKNVILTPEEWVRQHIIHYLIYDYKFPKTLISVEKQLLLNDLQKRTDIVLFDQQAKPKLIIECKAPEIKLSQDVFDQIARYNLILQVPYLWVTNGSTHYICKIDHQFRSWEFMEALPDMRELVDIQGY